MTRTEMMDRLRMAGENRRWSEKQRESRRVKELEEARLKWWEDARAGIKRPFPWGKQSA